MKKYSTPTVCCEFVETACDLITSSGLSFDIEGSGDVISKGAFDKL